MTAEAVLTSVLYEIGLEKASPNVASNDYDVAQLREYMNQAGRDIASRAEWSGLYKTDTVAGAVSTHALPQDFREMGERGSVYLAKASGTYTPVRVIVSPTMFDFVAQFPSSQIYCHLRDGDLKFSETLDSDGAQYTYVSRNWVAGDKAKVTENADTFHIPERLLRGLTVVLWLREKGQPYDDQLAEYEANLVADIKADRGQA